MARFRRFKNYYGRARSFGRRSYGGNSVQNYAVFGGAAVASFMGVIPTVHPLQDALINVIAIAPVKVPRTLRNACGGYVFGKTVRAFTGAAQTNGGFNFI